MDSYLIAAYSLTAFLATVGTVLKVAIGLGFVIFVHELGHFLAAKACGVKCEKFYVGFDIPMKFGPIRLPSTLGKFQWGETEYGIGILPLGGYVKMLGQDDNPMNAEKEAERIRLEQGGDDTGSQPEGPTEFDPRSFPAKPVWQRLIIISAGVIMNLIFAVIFAAVAYKSGLEYAPCEIDGTAAGDPAWIVGLEAGDKIVQIGKNMGKDEHMRFDWELREKVITAGVGSKVQQMDLLIRRNGEEKWYQITPTSRAKKLRKTVSLGVLQPRSTKIRKIRPTVAHTSAAGVDGLGGKRVVAINDIPLPRDEETQEIFSYHLSKHLVLHVSEPVTLTLEETNPKDKTTSPTTTTVTVPPNPMKTLGIVMKVGPVTAVRKGSHAEAAGVQQGDILSKVDGQPVGDPITLEQRLQKKRNKEVTIVVLRDGQPVSIKVKVGSPQGTSDSYGYAAPAALTSIGITFRVEPKVASVEPGSAAAEQGIKAGDVIESVAFDLVDSNDKELRKQAKAQFGKRYNVPIEIGEDDSSWPHIHTNMQSILPGMHLIVAIKRGDETETKNLVPTTSKDYFLSERGIVFVPFSRVHKAENWGEAVRLGYRETKEKLFSVLWVLQKLVTGQISVTNLGGPVLIAYVAGSEANRGIARLLVFLTMLSANLAVLNFLPIPALDGGHAVFLCWEGVTGKPASERIQGTLTLIGVALLLCLMLAVLVMDIGRLLP